ncbi:DUF3391 domain-containing protein [Pseudomonas sp. MWU13-2100]|uniref:DUF3391 domain-containing protein n=1 Tax=Pseudomonas sp. MWU13-2100 TaxID=2935075 RepID=UPI002010AA61|nr:DUF3391 domain-containing protein [Pseudomonas sp. MWU13-2100]
MLKKVFVADLSVGMYIQELCGPWIDHPFWKKSFLLEGELTLVKVRDSSITHVWIDPAKGIDTPEVVQPLCEVPVVAPVVPIAAVPSCTPKPERARVEMSDELVRAANVCARSKVAVIEMFGDLRMGRVIQMEHCCTTYQPGTGKKLEFQKSRSALDRRRL